MTELLAEIRLFKGKHKRQTPFYSGYRPTFKFIEMTRTSGEINLLNVSKLDPGDRAIVLIKFVSEEFLGDNLGKGITFQFFEAKEPLGEGVVLGLIV
ncbi:MAG: hypothetical protein AAF741_07250 [Bacteroidota bacterium]